MMQTKRCTAAMKAGRLHKAEQFLRAAEVLVLVADEDDLIDAHVTLCIHAGIAAADVICCALLGVHASGRSHHEAVDLLGRVDSKLANDLRRLLSLKTRSGYDAATSSAASQAGAERAARRLVQAESAPRNAVRRRPTL